MGNFALANERDRSGCLEKRFVKIPFDRSFAERFASARNALYARRRARYAPRMTNRVCRARRRLSVSPRRARSLFFRRREKVPRDGRAAASVKQEAIAASPGFFHVGVAASPTSRCAAEMSPVRSREDLIGFEC